jgi:molybdenum cofactor guanylyltransferase
MGTEKGHLRIGDRLLYQLPLAVLENSCDEILVGTCRDSIIPVHHRVVCDEVKGIGPLGGIYSCLKGAANELSLVISYDMPLVNDALVTLLLHEAEGYDLVLPAMEGRKPEPLCGLYRKSVIPLIKEMIRENDYAVHHLLMKCNSRIINISEKMECWHPDLFLNINSREDLVRLMAGSGIRQDEE